MPSGLVKPSSEIEPIVGIQFGIFSPEEIERRSVVEITSYQTYEGNEPKIGGLFDPRMGVLDNGKTCRSCGQTNHNCPGHFGHYRLSRPVYFFQFFETILNVLQCVCIRCSKLLLDKSVHTPILKRRGEARWKEILTRCKNISRCGQETEDGCGARKPSRITREGIATIVAEWLQVEGAGMKDAIEGQARAEGVAGLAATTAKQVLEVEYVLRLFRRITDEDVDFMGLNRYWCRPDWMICTVMPIPPPQVRPSVIQDNNQRSEDDLTHKLFDIIKNDQALQDKINTNQPKHVIDQYMAILQYHVATLVDNQIPGVAPSAQRSGRPLKSIQQRLGSKEGRIRYNIQGKRVEFSARSVITPDPNLSIAEIGVPVKIAKNLSVPERVTPYNIKQMYKLIQNGADVHPGAKSVVQRNGHTISLKHVNRNDIVLHLGDTINRHLNDGDIILFNRQPTLHRMSMMGHRVKVLPYNTFRLNVSVTAPYNADFDGDEMNAHIPQSYEASTELMEIAAVPHQIISPRNGKPVIGIVQDTLAGSYRITRPSVEFNRREFMNLMMWNKRFEGQVPEPLQMGEQRRWTGQQVLSQLMPPINLKMKNDSDSEVEIIKGNILKGIFDKSIFSKPSKGIIHVTYNDYGPKDTVNLIDAMQNTVEQFLVYNGFSVGISDLVADDQTNLKIQEDIKKKKKEIEDIILQVHLDLFDNNTGKSNQEEFESRVIGSLNKATEAAGKIGLGSLAQENRLIAMVKAGSKGSTINIAQMMACVGQQAPEGRRIPYGFTDRTLPHYKKYDDGAEARGFVESSFIRGLTPQEFFFHAMSGREGLIDTAVKSVSGDTSIVIIEDGVPKSVQIGPWIDAILAEKDEKIQHFEENQMEYLDLEKPVYIPTTDAKGNVVWGDVKAITRHDPGENLYRIKTLGGRSVIVTEAQSLLIWNDEKKEFLPMKTPDVSVGNSVPVTMNLPTPPVVQTHVNMSIYLPKDKYIYTTNRDHVRIPDTFALTEENGIFIGLFLSEGNVDCTSGYVQITNKDIAIQEFVKNWFENQRIEYATSTKINHIGGTTSCVRGFTTVLAKFLDSFCGHGASEKHVPAEAFVAPDEFVCGILNGYFSGDGTVSSSSIEVGSASSELIDGINMLCNRIGVFGKMFTSQLEKNNLGTEHILPTYRLSIRAQWAKRFAEKVSFIDTEKEEKRKHLKSSESHRNFRYQNDCVLDEIIEITKVDTSRYPKMYDLTVPDTFNFGLANGLQVRDTADTGYIQRQLIKAMEDLTVQFDGTVRDARGNIIQFHYGEDGVNSTKIESTGLNIANLTEDDILNQYGMNGVDLSNILSIGREDDADALQDFAQQVLHDRKMLVEQIYRGKTSGSLFAPVNLERLIENVRVQFNLQTKMKTPSGVEEVKTDLQPFDVILGIQGVIEKTQTYHPLWSALLRYWCAPHKLIVEKRFTAEAFQTLCQMIVMKNWQSWAQPGEQVGIIAAQSIGEPSTQMTLNTFHLAGVAAKSNMTRGVPRLKELLKVTQNPKATSLTVFLKPEFRTKKEKAREVAQDLELTLLRDITVKAAIYFDPNIDKGETILEEDRELIKFFKLFEDMNSDEQYKTSDNEQARSRWVLRLELDRERMFNKNITMDDIAFVLSSRFENEIRMTYSDFNSTKMVLRINMNLDEKTPNLDPIDDLANVKKFQNKLLNGVVIRGVPGIKAVTFRKESEYVEYNQLTKKYDTIENHYVLDTDGSNFLEVMNHPAVDGRKLVSTHVHDIFENLGVEATRQVLLNEISELFEEAGVNFRHLGILCDVMTRAGRLMSVDRYGINKNDIGPLAKASFEETERILLRAAIFGEVDPITGVSANIMMGQPIRGGTSFSQVLLDEQALFRLMKGLPPTAATIEEEEEAPSDDVIDSLIYGNPDDPCASVQTQMNMMLPPKTEINDDEGDIELQILDEDDE